MKRAEETAIKGYYESIKLAVKEGDKSISEHFELILKEEEGH